MKRCGTRLSFAAALRELEIVHRRDQARLLREACAIACRRSALGRLYVAGWSARRGARPAWDRACEEEIESARADGFGVEPTLPRLLELPSSLWPRPTVLALASLSLRSSHAGRVDLARARIAEGDTPGAIGDLRTLLDDAPAAEVRGTALEALALALECVGDHPASLGCYAAAAGVARSDPRVSVAWLALALRAGDPAEVSLASERLARLDLAVAGTRRRFDGALRAARDRAVRERRASPRERTRELAWPILELALAGPRACSEVARTFT